MGGYLVTVTDTDTKNPVANATVTLGKDHTLSVRLPGSRLLNYADQTTIKVQLGEGQERRRGNVYRRDRQARQL